MPNISATNYNSTIPYSSELASDGNVLYPSRADRNYIDRLVENLDKSFCQYTGKHENLSSQQRVQRDFYKNDDFTAYFLEKSQSSVALCSHIVEQAWNNMYALVSHKINNQPEYRLDDYRRESLCQFAIRKMLKSVNEVINSTVQSQLILQNGAVRAEAIKNKQEKCEDVLSVVSYLLGLTTNKTEGAKQRYGSDPIRQVLFQEFHNNKNYIKNNRLNEGMLEDTINSLSNGYYQLNSGKEKLPNEQIINRVIKELQDSIANNSLMTDSAAYRIISKTIIDPVIMDANYEGYHRHAYLNALARTKLGKDISISNKSKHIHYLAANLPYDNKFSRLFLLDKTFDIRKSELYQRVEQHLREINENISADDILRCYKDYYEFARKKYALKMPSLVEIEFTK
ncbi:Uncharacterised protein [Yersinia pseudotuberculosis]|nr:hypothetical protein [Yersinia pseudotuberculosis]AJK15827.1 hypothetical protein BZ19_1934 [Yersinia pseudotuberculosis str. PA3606]CNH65810.1 Uncharacterised protein [Yersinia pseudotuberculosis]CNH95637.1 Uncharacterised protein [Yersinia pseudotuberculosis]CNL53988.1 Uncharacterised protein [Yersinia pseudotuberculosis]BCU89952.1 hypothetical protein YP72344_14470 [Yersinia pseudotuberculosis]